MNEKICCIANKGKTVKNEWENLMACSELYTVYIKKNRTILFPFLFDNLNKDISVILKVINI